MLMPLEQLRAIYEVLFRDGVLVAKKDERPQSLHPEIQGVTNLRVMRAMASLKSRGFVRETFAWRHYYWYLSNEGVAFLREYLHLPPEIVPASLQRVRRPAVIAPRPAPRGRGIQTVRAPATYAPKRPAGGEGWGSTLDRQAYRKKEEAEEVVQRVAAVGVAKPAPGPAPSEGLQ
uniref:Plectin/eS10 N-terminal domain-containing protein n=1 Tax=Latimeria chalumnae TaxID=7897 RepID=H3AS61_LATCH